MVELILSLYVVYNILNTCKETNFVKYRNVFYVSYKYNFKKDTPKFWKKY